MQDIISLGRQGDKRAQKMLFDLYKEKIMFLCRRYFANTQEAEDAFIESYMKMFDKLGSYTYIDDKSFVAWFRKLTANNCLNKIRQRRSFVLSLDEQLERGDDSALQVVEDEKKEVLTEEDLFLCLSELPDNLRTVFNLVVIDGYSQKEAALRLETTEKTIKTMVYRARKSLKDKTDNLLSQRQKKEKKERK